MSKNKSEMEKKFNITVISGDGIGPEVMQEALKVLRAVLRKYHYSLRLKEELAGGRAWDKYGIHLPKQTIAACECAEAILFGAVGGAVASTEQKWRGVEENVIGTLRKHFNLFANIRPISSGDINLVIVRELSSGIYYGRHSIKGNAKRAVAKDVMQYTSDEIERILHVAFSLAQKRKKHLTLVDKANVLATSKLWREVAEDIRGEYKDVALAYMYVDNAAYQIATNPLQFDVIATSNLFGDILSDEAVMWEKSLGMIGSASLRDDAFGLYEPAHGSAPDIAGQNKANPIGMIRSAALMLRYSFGLEEGAQEIERAVNAVLAQGYGTPDLQPAHVLSTSACGNLIADYIQNGRLTTRCL